MIHPSKKAAAMAVIEQRRHAAFHTKDLVAYNEAVAELAELEAAPHEYTCIHCGHDFPESTPHVEFLIAACLVFDLRVPTMPNHKYTELFIAGRFDELEDVPQQIPIPDAAPELVATEHYDYGIGNASVGAGRRIKICGDCVGEWGIHPRDYIEMR